jgi:hypothetical protein
MYVCMYICMHRYVYIFWFVWNVQNYKSTLYTYIHTSYIVYTYTQTHAHYMFFLECSEIQINFVLIHTDYTLYTYTQTHEHYMIFLECSELQINFVRKHMPCVHIHKHMPCVYIHKHKPCVCIHTNTCTIQVCLEGPKLQINIRALEDRPKNFQRLV